MSRRPIAALLAVIGATLVGLGVAGTGVAAARASSTTYALQYVGPQAVVARWAPCVRTATGSRPQVIRYKINPAGKPSRIAFVKTGIRKLERATGLRFRYAGRTSYVPQMSPLTGFLRARQQERRTGVDFVVAWAFRGHGGGRSNLLTTGEAGVGSISWRFRPGVSQLRISDAAVVMERGNVGLRAGFGAGGTSGTLLLHELGHAVGLLHASNPHEVMYPFVGSQSPASYARGDRRGLHAVGAHAGCMTGPRLPA
ncbi:MAG: matrixin family metalloprotease [Frankiales bacterium]|nr:matrixin family metalloprotease [Frankiales bacterium]